MQCMSNLTVRIPADLRRELKKIGGRQQRPLSEVVRDSLRRYVASEQLWQIRARTRPKAESRGFLTEDDVFKAVS
jgi:predicted transcriptional regulator